jgi:uncharacterized protein
MPEPNQSDLAARRDACCRILRNLERVVVAFSAGVDSTLLAALAAETLGPANVVAAMGLSPSLPQRERDDGRRLARAIGVELVELETHELADAHYAANPTNRCFYCKRELFQRLKTLAAARGFPAVVCGANADDRGDFRPGLQAGEELGVRAPLMEAGLTKRDVRDLSRTLGLPTAEKPASACLASRVPYDEPITAERLGRIERAENALKDLGFAACRVRDHAPVARIEVPAAAIPRLVEAGPAVVDALIAAGYAYVTVDLAGLRSGSMNEVLSDADRSRPGPAKAV